jgi:hypothetical protein
MNRLTGLSQNFQIWFENFEKVIASYPSLDKGEEFHAQFIADRLAPY